jgi:hypothetical protein
MTNTTTPIRENKGSVVNRGYLNATMMPPRMLTKLLKVYDRTRRTMAALFGADAIALPVGIATEGA